MIILWLLALGIVSVFSNCKRINDGLADKIMVIAHKGYHVNAHENTLESFDAAYKKDFKNIEFDIHFSKDYQPFIFHDEVLDGISDTTGTVYELYLKDIEKVNLTGGAKIPSFEGFLKNYVNAFNVVFIDIKEPCPDSGLINFAKLISKYNFYAQSVITSSNPDVIVRLKNIDTLLSLGADGDFEDDLFICIEQNYKYLLVRSVQLNKHLCYIAHAKGVKV